MPRPSQPPTTVKALYQAITGDTASHQRTIDAHLRRMEARRRRMIRRRAQGATLYQIAEEEGISHGSVQSVILKAFHAIRKAIAGEPRYTYGHPGRRKKPEESPA